MRVERATPSDVPGVEGLLAAAGLPLEGTEAALALGVVARDGDEIVAAAAIERYGDAGLLFPRLGYQAIARAEAAAAVGESLEFTTVCKDTGVPMRRILA